MSQPAPKEPTVAELAGIPAAAHLTAEEAQFVYLVEVLGLPTRVAVRQSGMPPTLAYAPHIAEARDQMKRVVNGPLPSKEDCVRGYVDAIGRARTINEPATEIMGWREIAKILGHDAPQRVDVHITATVDALRAHVKYLDDEQLAHLAGAKAVIDADFYRISDGKEDSSD